MSFGHLHIHNEFSLLDGLGSANDYAAKAKELNQEYIALTNHGNIDGLLKFQRTCQKQGIKPILGCEAYIVNDLSVKEKGEKRNHVTLLIKNEKGFHNLCKLLTIANLEGFYYKPRIDIQALMNHCEGLIVLSGCSVGILSMPDCQEIIVSLQKKLKSDFYLEVMPHEFKDQKAVNKLACSLSGKYNIPLVATNDCHYVHADDSESHEVLLAMQTQAKWADKSRFRFSTRGLFLCSEKQMRHRFLKQGVLSLKQIDEAIHSTEAIASKCDFTIAKQNIFLPAVPLYKDKDPYKLLLTMTRRKLQELIKEYALDDKEKKIYQARLSEEWKLIQSKGFVAYFCIVKELIDFCKANDIMVGAGRGSVGGSLVAFLLGITCVDPIKYNLLFSRFINEARQDLPDIDLDFEDNKREQVKEHLRELYGENNIASISTFLTMKGKAVVRDVARVFDVPLKEVDEFAKNISYYEEGDVIVAACKTDTGKGFAKKYPQVIKHAIKLEGTNKASGQHAAACIISADDLTKGTKGNLASRKDQLVSNWDMEDSEHMGLMKLDVLGLNTLTVLHAFQKEILKNHNKEIDFIKLPLHSAKVYKQIAEGNNVGIFQISGWATNKLAPQIQADNIFGLSDLVALSRPGVSDSGMTDLYIERRQGNRWEKKHPVYEEITKHTYGIIVYQEQVMEMIYKIAGLPYTVADKIRKIIAKKRDIKEFQQYEDMFIEGCLKQGYFDKNEAMEFWETLQVFGGYLFNKSHAIAYAITAYWTAWARCYYPVEYICALLNYGSDNEKNKKEYIDEARRLNLEIRMPSLAHSDPLKWKAKDGILYVPFIEIKGVGEKLIEKCIMSEVAQEPKGKGMTGFFQIKEKKPKETTNKLKAILDKLTALEQEGNRPELQKYFSFNI
jgi:DNA polymerase III subunit alpha